MLHISIMPLVFLSGLTGASAPYSVETRLTEWDPQYDAEIHLLRRKWHSPGYHTRIPNGEWVHPTRDSFVYALYLLKSGEPERAERAAEVFRALLPVQDTDPESRTYGVWPWLYEEPLNEMGAPDFNWADFCGVVIAQALIEHKDALPADLVEAMRESLDHATKCIVKRNVGPGYTNIAIMGAGVTLAGGEILGKPELVEYGAKRLHGVVKHHAYHGDFNEFNSPTYTMVALYECERVLQLVKHEKARADAETLRRAAWQVIAEHYHPATGMWAGPHSRSYGLWPSAETMNAISRRTGVDIPLHPEASRSVSSWPGMAEELPSPPELLRRFKALPESPTVVKRRVFRRGTETDSTWITTWLTERACLGTANRSTFWTQAVSLKAYWNGADGVPVALRMRFLHDRVDFASGCVRHCQQDGRVLSAVGFVTGKGDYHPSLDRPKGGVFVAKDFRLRYELTDAGAEAVDMGEGRFALSAGAIKAVVHTAPGRFADTAVRWEVGGDRDSAWVDAVCYSGDERAFKLADVKPFVLAAGLEILDLDAEPSEAAVRVDKGEDGMLNCAWPVSDELRLSVPSFATRQP